MKKLLVSAFALLLSVGILNAQEAKKLKIIHKDIIFFIGESPNIEYFNSILGELKYTEKDSL